MADRTLPRPLYHAVRRLYRYPNWYLGVGKASQRSLSDLRDAFRGRRAVIIGNGPSLARTDMARLAGEATFGLNRVYKGFEQFGFATTWLVCVNDLVLRQSSKEIAALPMPKFIAWQGRRAVPPGPDVTYLRTRSPRPGFVGDVRRELWEGATVTFVALQLAFHMGFEEVVLVGVDHSFATSGPAHTTVRLDRGDGDHFLPDYFPPGFEWQLPDLEMSEYAYELARRHFEAAGRRIIDATIDGKLNVFEKASFDGVFPADR
jgi:hypothetical protein